MASAVFVLCALTSTACAVLLVRAHSQARVALLLWTALCFVGLAMNNVLLVIDMYYSLDLAIWRKIPAVIGVVLLLYGLIADPSRVA